MSPIKMLFGIVAVVCGWTIGTTQQLLLGQRDDK